MAQVGRYKQPSRAKIQPTQGHPFNLTLWNSLMRQQCTTERGMESLAWTNVDSERTKIRNALLRHKFMTMPNIDTLSEFKFKQDPSIAKILPPPPNPRRRRRSFSKDNGDASLLMTPLPLGLPSPLIPYVDSGSISSSNIAKELNIELPSASKTKDDLSMEDKTRDLLSEYKPGPKNLDAPLQPKILLSSLTLPQFEDRTRPAASSANMWRSVVTHSANTPANDPLQLMNSPRWGRAIPKDQLMLPSKRIASADAASSKPRSLSVLRASWNLVRRPVTAATSSPLGMRTVTTPISTDASSSFNAKSPSIQLLHEAGALRRLPLSRETSRTSKSSRSATSDSKTTKNKKNKEGSSKKIVRKSKGSDILTFKKMCDFVNNLLLVEAKVEKKTNWRYRYFCDWIEMGREYRLAVERLRLLKTIHQNKMVDDALKQTSLYSFYSGTR